MVLTIILIYSITTVFRKLPREIKMINLFAKASPVLLATSSLISIAFADPNPALATQTVAIPLNQIGAVAGNEYSGPGLAVRPDSEGATLTCAFQRLDASVTTKGLWLVSTKEGAQGEPFRVTASALGRGNAEPLPSAGKVEAAGKIVRFIRPGLTEAYSVSVDGLRQDFMIKRRPAGTGLVRVELQVAGARADALANGVRLVLADRGRELVYNQVNAVDARGRALTAKLDVLSPNRLAVILDDAGAEYPVLIDPTFSDANWASLGAWNSNGEIVKAVAADGSGNVYIGGDFNSAGGIAATNIAQWNGSSWSALGPGMNSEVDALAIFGTNLYAAGLFTMTGSNAVGYIAQWNGSSWSGMGSGMNYYVDALAVSSNGTLYAGGWFSTAGGISAVNVAQWNGKSWSALGPGLGIGPFGVDDPVLALMVSGGTVYAGTGGVVPGSVDQWNGTNWSSLGSRMNGIVDTLAVSGGILYAGGSFTTVTNNGNAAVTVNYIAQWNGTNWSSLGSGMNTNGDVNALAVSGNTLYAGGDFTNASGTAANFIAQWNGSSWSPLGSGMDNDVYALALSGGILYAGGNFTTAGGKVCYSVAEAFLAGTPFFIITDNRSFGFTNGQSQFGFDVNAPAGLGETLVIQGTTNLVNWVPLETNVLSSSPWHFSDHAASSFKQRFYRALLVQ